MTVGNPKIQALVDDAVKAVVKFKGAKDSRAAHYWEGRATALEQAMQVRLTDAETAVIEAAQAMTGPRSPRLALALAALRKERGLPVPPGERRVTAYDPNQVAEKVVADAHISECRDCGSGLHSTGSDRCLNRSH